MKATLMKQSTSRLRSAVVATAIIATLSLGAFQTWRLPKLAQMGTERVGTTIPADYFGMTMNYIGLQNFPQSSAQNSWPDFDFGGVRLWGAIYWAQINPAPGIYNWARFDAILDAAAKHHVDVIFTLAFTPRWAATEKDAEPFFSRGGSSPPADPASWQDFIRAAVARAAGRIRYWEIWNEPEDPKYYSGDVATMVELQKSAFETIKAIDPSLMVLTPSSIGSVEGFKWTSKFLAAGGGQYADILAFHGYWDHPDAEPVVDIIRRFKDLYAANGLAGKPIWDTEAGWQSTMFDEERQAGFIARSYLLRWSLGINRFYWYAYEGGGGNFGKLWDPGRGLLLPGVAYRTVHHWMVGATVKGALEHHGSVWSLALRLSDGRHAIAVWDVAGRSRYALPANYDRYQRLDGQDAPIVNGTVEIGSQPILAMAKGGLVNH
jgi:hypothetical protein